MIGLIAPLLIGIAIAMIRGGSFAAWGRVQVRWWPLVLGGLVVQLILFNPPIDQWGWVLVWGPWIWVASLVAIFVALARNSLNRNQAAPLLLAALGVGLNLAVVVANGGLMPQSVAARVDASGATVPDQSATQLRNVAPLTATTRLPWLADVLAEPRWLPRANVLSVGDILLALGLGWWAYGVTRRDGFAPVGARAAAPSAGS